ncbi:DinI-like family protein [Vibrio echinoideorum]
MQKKKKRRKEEKKIANRIIEEAFNEADEWLLQD